MSAPSPAKNGFLSKMLDRLYAAMSSGPSINCRPQNSRQRIDLHALRCLEGPPPEEVLAHLLGDEQSVRYQAPLANRAVEAADDEAGLGDGERALRRAAREQQSALRKLAVIAEDAAAYENETGAQALFVGFPLLALPPDRAGKGRFASARRVLAPVAFVPVRLTVKRGRAPSAVIESCGAGIDRVIPNAALLAWAEQQSGQKLRDLFADEAGAEPWREIDELVGAVCRALDVPVPPGFGPGTAVRPAPRGDDVEAGVVASGVLGLFPLPNQSLVRDLEALVEGEVPTGPIESFLKVDAGAAEAGRARAQPSGAPAERGERLVSPADPCQARAVRLARTAKGLVIHGPPGSGKSQTIANAIGDHLSRGERVLFVCDKRTALDVVKHRLDALGLGGLCAVVHDAQRDQRELYTGIRDQLEGLVEARVGGAAALELEKLDAELGQLRGALEAHDRALNARPSPAEPSFHEVAGSWLEAEVQAEHLAAAAPAREGRLADLDAREPECREALERGLREGWAGSSWRSALGVDLAGWIAAPIDERRRAVERVGAAARQADGAGSPDIPPFDPRSDLLGQGQARAEVGSALRRVVESGHAVELARWAAAPRATLAPAKDELSALRPQVQILRAGPLDPELSLAARDRPNPLAQVSLWTGKLESYLEVARRWYGFLFLFRRLKAAAILACFGLAFSRQGAERVLLFLRGVRSRALLNDFQRRLLPAHASAAQDLPDGALESLTSAQEAIFAALDRIDGDPALAPLAPRLRAGLSDPRGQPAVIEGLERSLPRAEALAALEREAAAASLFSERWRAELAAGIRAGERAGPVFSRLAAELWSVEGLLRVEATLRALPPPIQGATRALLDLSAGPEAGLRALKKAALEGELSRRLRASPALVELDGPRLEAMHRRCRELGERKRELVRGAALDLWLARQKERLVAQTGTRLGGAATELRRRLMLRGERVMKVRQVVAAGAGIEGGDPLFDLRPVWMASPETVAQIFPRRPVFDLVIFDESSQCRLEEALPVLTRGRRLVVAGDPKQLPPTRFFESAVAHSEEAEAEGEQSLFEEQQAEVEDLLGAALNLEIEQAYLDVHYRSRNGALIEFSNRHFYDSRLQAIPGHPSSRAAAPPVALVPVGGTYEKRVNLREAEEVVAIVRRLLSQPNPPSVGVACFNLSQRDAIAEALDEAAAADPGFAARLAEARARRGPASFEGLFVKNLENVQGDERDHIVISTTYGPDAKGRFRRQFGPLGRAGGGRRLNVLVTRAREQVHLVTSIPREAYASLPEVEPGQTPSGAWLLFAYLRWAEGLGDPRQEARPGAAAGNEGRAAGRQSAFARSLAAGLARSRGTGADVCWGNEGFCVDVALRHPRRPEDVTLGLLCDGTRYDKAPDRVEWDLFRTAVLESQGWKLMRVWTPQFFRDPDSSLKRIDEEVARLLASEAPRAVGLAGGSARPV